MRAQLFAIAGLVALALPSVALADDSGAAAGAATGAVAGAVVGGPIGAVVGAGIGGVAGGAASGPDRERVIVQQAPCERTTVRQENSYGESKTTVRDNC